MGSRGEFQVVDIVNSSHTLVGGMHRLRTPANLLAA